MLQAAGWTVQAARAVNLSASRGVAVREFVLKAASWPARLPPVRRSRGGRSAGGDVGSASCVGSRNAAGMGRPTGKSVRLLAVFTVALGVPALSIAIASADSPKPPPPSKPAAGASRRSSLPAGTYSRVSVAAASVRVVGPSVVIQGDLTMKKGASLTADGATITGSLAADSPASIRIGTDSSVTSPLRIGKDIHITGATGGTNEICDSQVDHDFTIKRSAPTAAWAVGDATDGCSAGNTIGHDLAFRNNRGCVRPLGQRCRARPVPETQSRTDRPQR